MEEHTNRLPRWLLWLIGAATLLAAAIMIMAVVLGVRAGQQQLEIQKRQQVGIHLQRAIDYRSDGDLEAALAEYQRVLLLEPGNVAAVQGIENLFSMASGNVNAAAVVEGQASAATTSPAANPTPPSASSQAPAQSQTSAAAAPVAAAPSAASPLATPPATTDTLTNLWRTAEAAYTAGDWISATDLLLNIREIDPDFQASQVTDRLYTSYVNLAAEKDQAGQLEDALAFVDQALALRPDPTLRTARTKAQSYLKVLNTYSLGWETVIEQLEALYDEDPAYRDVEDRLLEAYTAFGDKLARDGNACDALDAYVAAIEINVQPILFEKRDTARATCDGVPSTTVVLLTPEPTRRTSVTRPSASPATPTTSAATTGTTVAGATGADDAAADDLADATVDIAADDSGVGSVAPAVGSPSGSIMYSATSINDGRARIFSQPIAGGAPQIVVEDGSQPALRADGTRLVYYNTRSDMAGLSALDPGSGLQLRFTSYAEDRRPSWNPEGNRLVFASNREGDRRWRIYVGWAEVDGEVATLGFGEGAAWSPAGDRIAIKGCDETGNGCGLWTMTSSGANRSPLTTIPEDSSPSWSPDGRYVVFMSNGRHGNFEVYKVDTVERSVTRLTDNPANDGAPTVSPDGNWVAFLSNRDGAWKIWGVPITGGDAVVLATPNGDIGGWLDQQIQWTN